MIYSKVTLKDLTPIILDLSKCLFFFFLFCSRQSQYCGVL